jgi:hypothetical protein
MVRGRFNFAGTILSCRCLTLEKRDELGKQPVTAPGGDPMEKQ